MYLVLSFDRSAMLLICLFAIVLTEFLLLINAKGFLYDDLYFC